MSYRNFEKAMILAPKCKFYTTVGGKSSKDIQTSEELLGIKFSKKCIEFYAKYGYLSFFGSEIFGIDPNDDSEILEGNSVAYELNDRKEYNLPEKWIPIYSFEDGNMAYLDYDNLDVNDEPRVIMAIFNGGKFEFVEVLTEDFGDFLLELVQQQLDSQR